MVRTGMASSDMWVPLIPFEFALSIKGSPPSKQVGSPHLTSSRVSSPNWEDRIAREGQKRERSSTSRE